MDHATKEDLREVHEATKAARLRLKTDDVSDSFFSAMRKMRKKVYCSHCKQTFGIYDVESNENYDTWWCLECDNVIFTLNDNP